MNTLQSKDIMSCIKKSDSTTKLDESTDFDFSLIKSKQSHFVVLNFVVQHHGFTTAFAILHLVTLTIKDSSLHGSDHLVQSRGN